MVREKNKKIKYSWKNFDPEQLDALHIDRQAVEQIANHSLVLDVGCATGYIGDYLIRKKHCSVIGVEQSKLEASFARSKLTNVILGDIEERKIMDRVRHTYRKKFDCILMLSVIEHLKKPEATIKKLPSFLKKDGIIVVSTPNIAHWTIRLSLLRGVFMYSEFGIMDKTHLHFYTFDTFKKLFESNGFSIQHFSIDSVGGGYPRISRLLGLFFPKLFGYQMLLVATPTL